MKVVFSEDDIKKALVLYYFARTSIELDKKDINLKIDFSTETICSDVNIDKKSK